MDKGFVVLLDLAHIFSHCVTYHLEQIFLIVTQYISPFIFLFEEKLIGSKLRSAMLPSKQHTVIPSQK